MTLLTDKVCALETAVAAIPEGATIMVGGFGSPGTPFALLDALLASGQGGLTLIKNDANEPGIGISRIFEAGLAKSYIVSHIGLNSTVVELMNTGKIQVEFSPQGILAERIRAGGAGLMGIVTDIGIDTILREKRRIIEVDGREAFFEPALRADVALIHAAAADKLGNLVYAKSARNFNPLMAMAADLVIAEAEEIVAPGDLDPDQIHTPAAFVDHLVPIPEITEEYGVLAHHVLET